jgi:hypothetical protein
MWPFAAQGVSRSLATALGTRNGSSDHLQGERADDAPLGETRTGAGGEGGEYRPR